MAVSSVFESGLYFEPTVSDWFRFETCPGFKLLKGLGVCEMDFGWYVAATQTQWLLELRDYSTSGRPVDLAQNEARRYLEREFVQKAKDCLLLLGSVWHGLPHEATIRPCLPAGFHLPPTQNRRLKLVFVVKTDAPGIFQAHAQPLQDVLRNKLNGQCELLGIRGSCDILLLDHQVAIDHGLPLREEVASGPRSRRRSHPAQ